MRRRPYPGGRAVLAGSTPCAATRKSPRSPPGQPTASPMTMIDRWSCDGCTAAPRRPARIGGNCHRVPLRAFTAGHGAKWPRRAIGPIVSSIRRCVAGFRTRLPAGARAALAVRCRARRGSSVATVTVGRTPRTSIAASPRRREWRALPVRLLHGIQSRR
jgi:hypothetical protein